jgi:hypothetical protein
MEVKTSTIGSESGHWYNEDGLVLAVPSADDKKMVRPTVRHARNGLVVPSVTGILGIFDKPALTQWKIKEHVKACAYIKQKRAKETFDNYFKRVVEQMNRHNDHAQLGTNIHAEIAKGLAGEHHDEIADKTIEFVKSQMAQLKNPTIKSEMPFANMTLGFGGTVDCLLISEDEKVFIDFKTTDDDKLGQAEKLAYRDSHLAQLVAYDLGTNITATTTRYFNVFIGRLGGNIFVHEWSNADDVNWARKFFLLSLKIFKHKNGLN